MVSRTFAFGNSGYRFLAATNGESGWKPTRTGPATVYDMMEQYLDARNLPSSLANITVATLSMKIAALATEKGGTVTFDVSFPNSSNLKSEKRARLRDIAEKYLKQWGIDRA